MKNKYKFTLKAENKIHLTPSPIGTGAPVKDTGLNYSELVSHCISKEEIFLEVHTFKIITPKMKIKPITIAKYIIEKEGIDYSAEWLAKKEIKPILETLPNVTKNGKKYYKKVN